METKLCKLNATAISALLQPCGFCGICRVMFAPHLPVSDWLPHLSTHTHLALSQMSADCRSVYVCVLSLDIVWLTGIINTFI